MPFIFCSENDEDSTCQVSPMLYQTWQVVTAAPDADRDSHIDPPGSPVRPPKARKPTLGEEQLRRMHTSIRNSARRHNRKNLRWDEQPKVSAVICAELVLPKRINLSLLDVSRVLLPAIILNCMMNCT